MRVSQKVLQFVLLYKKQRIKSNIVHQDIATGLHSYFISLLHHQLASPDFHLFGSMKEANMVEMKNGVTTSASS